MLPVREESRQWATAAGDSFVGAFCTGFCCGLDWEELLTFANHVAAILVTGMGALPSLPELEQVEQLLKKEEIVFPELAVLKSKSETRDCGH